MKAENDKKLTDEELNKANGGFAGTDKYTIDEYAEAGVIHIKRDYWYDCYIINGISICQTCATIITEFYFKNGRRCNDKELKEIMRIFQ